MSELRSRFFEFLASQESWVMGLRIGSAILAAGSFLLLSSELNPSGLASIILIQALASIVALLIDFGGANYYSKRFKRTGYFPGAFGFFDGILIIPFVFGSLLLFENYATAVVISVLGASEALFFRINRFAEVASNHNAIFYIWLLKVIQQIGFILAIFCATSIDVEAVLVTYLIANSIFFLVASGVYLAICNDVGETNPATSGKNEAKLRTTLFATGFVSRGFTPIELVVAEQVLGTSDEVAYLIGARIASFAEILHKNYTSFRLARLIDSDKEVPVFNRWFFLPLVSVLVLTTASIFAGAYIINYISDMKVVGLELACVFLSLLVVVKSVNGPLSTLYDLRISDMSRFWLIASMLCVLGLIYQFGSMELSQFMIALGFLYVINFLFLKFSLSKRTQM